MKRLMENLFFRWHVISFFIILLATEAMVLAIDGHFYNETILIYMLPILLWHIRGTVRKFEIRFTTLAGAGLAGVAAAGAFTLAVRGAKLFGDTALNHVAPKAVYVGMGTAVIVFYLIACICDNLEILKQREWKEYLCYAVLSFMLIPGLWVQREISIFSITAWIVAVVCLVSGLIREREDRRTGRLIGLVAIVCSCCMVFGNMIHIEAFVDSTGKKLLLGLLVGLVGWFEIWRQSIGELLRIAERNSGCRAGKSSGQGRSVFLRYLMIMLVAWIPYFLAFYPGVLSSDSVSQVQQIIGQLPSSNHHPWIHTQLIGVCYRLGVAVFGSPNAGVAVYSVVSMLIQGVAFAGICTWQYRAGIPRMARILSIIYLAFCPFHAIYSITMWKDIPFTAFIILFMLLVLKLTKEGKAGAGNRGDAAAYILLSILVCIFRSNGIYVWMFTLPFLLWQLRREWKRWSIYSGVAFAVVMLYKAVLLPSLEVIEPDTIESLSIPAQQIACVIAKGGEISEQALDELSQVVALDKVAETYNRHTSDPIKKLVRATDNMEYITEHGSEFAKLYIETGLKNPYDYLEAFVEQTKGYWHHKENDWIYHTTFITDNKIDIYRDGKLPSVVITGMEKVLELCLNGFHVVCSLALFTYAVLFCAMVNWKNRKPIVVYMPLIGLVLTLLIATPRYGDFRYVYALFAALPLYLGSMVYSFRSKEEK